MIVPEITSLFYLGRIVDHDAQVTIPTDGTTIIIVTLKKPHWWSRPVVEILGIKKRQENAA